MKLFFRRFKKLLKVGGSLAITVPVDIVKHFDAESGDRIEVIFKGIIKKAKNKIKNVRNDN